MKRLTLILSVLCGQALFAEVLQTITITPEHIELKEDGSRPLHATGHYSTGVDKEITSKVEWSVTDTSSFHLWFHPLPWWNPYALHQKTGETR